MKYQGGEKRSAVQDSYRLHPYLYDSAVYTGIKNPNLSRIQVFRWKLLGNFP